MTNSIKIFKSFCRGGKIISVHAGYPYSCELIGPNEPSDLVIELPCGTAKKIEATKGSEVEVSLSPQTIEKKAKYAISYR